MFEFVIKRKPRTMHRELSVNSIQRDTGKIRKAKWPQPFDEERKKPGVHMYVPADVKAFMEEVGWAAKAGGVKPIKGPVGVHITVYLYLEPGGSEEGLGDTDNFAKTIFDGMKKVAYEDDYQIRHHSVDKDYVGSPAEERAVVQVGTMKEMRPPTRLDEMLKWFLSKFGVNYKEAREPDVIVIEVDELPFRFRFSPEGCFLKVENPLEETEGHPT